jgi:hypothetical protein
LMLFMVCLIPGSGWLSLLINKNVKLLINNKL